ncbi:MAG: ABC transporter permease [Bacteroidales bacterium]|nr:ABC transporter permease [Bacteroidales bacterium]
MQLVKNSRSSEPNVILIRPTRSLLDVNLREIWKYRDLIVLFVRRDFVALYKQTILGPLWFLIQPLLTTLMYTIVFANIAKISTSNMPPILFYMSGTVAWTYFSTSLVKTSDTFINNANIFGKVYFPRLAVPISIILSNMIQFFIQFILFLFIMLIYAIKGTHFNLGADILLIPYLLIVLAGLGLGFGIIISSLTTKYRDLKQLVAFGVQLWMYATPVIFPLSEINGKYRIFFLLNPLTGVIETFRTILLGVGQLNLLYLGYSTGFMLVLLTLGVILFNRIERSFMDYI